MIKQFLKWLDLVPLIDSNNERIAYAFLNKVFNSFDIQSKYSSIKIYSMGEFHELCENILINRHTISSNNLEVKNK